MTSSTENMEKIHYICQTYVENKVGHNGRTGLKIGVAP